MSVILEFKQPKSFFARFWAHVVAFVKTERDLSNAYMKRVANEIPKKDVEKK